MRYVNKIALEEETGGIKITIRHTDDPVMIAECIEDLQRLMDKVVKCSVH